MAPDILFGTIPPGGIAVQVLVEMLPAALELIADKTDAVQPNTHGELLIFFLHLAVAGAFLRERLMVQASG